jgi:hypothetical protein
LSAIGGRAGLQARVASLEEMGFSPGGDAQSIYEMGSSKRTLPRQLLTQDTSDHLIRAKRSSIGKKLCEEHGQKKQMIFIESALLERVCLYNKTT